MFPFSRPQPGHPDGDRCGVAARDAGVIRHHPILGLRWRLWVGRYLGADSWIALLHPGPSVLVTVTFVAAAVLAIHRWPSLRDLAGLVAIMLPAQFAIGIANDLFDRELDAASKPTKPLVSGVADPGTARILAVVLVGASLAVSATVNLATLGGTLAGLTAGLVYDAGLKRTVWSWVPWVMGFWALPFTALAAVGVATVRVATVGQGTVGQGTASLVLIVPLGACLAVGLHLANAVPDIFGDGAAGIRSLPVRLGSRRSSAAASAFTAVAGLTAVAAAVAGLYPRRATPEFFGFEFGTAALLLCTVHAATRSPRRPFPVLAPASALFVVGWLGMFAAGPG